VVLIETADINSKSSRRWQMSVIREAAKAIGVPAYFVKHNRQCETFLVTRIDEPETVEIMSRKEYTEWLKNL
jgi:hypothetical protein